MDHKNTKVGKGKIDLSQIEKNKKTNIKGGGGNA